MFSLVLFLRRTCCAAAAICLALGLGVHRPLLAQTQAAVANASALTPPRLLTPDGLLGHAPAPTAGAEVRLVLELDINAEGSVQGAHLVDDGAAALETAALVDAALQQASALRFAPALQRGMPVPARIRVEMLFGAPPEDEAENEAEDPPALQTEGPPAEAGPGDHPQASPDPALAAPVAEATDGSQAIAASDQLRATPASTESEGFGAFARVERGAASLRATAASDYEIDIGALRAVPRRDAEQYLTLAPGVFLQNHSGVGHASSVLMRGFDAGEGEDLEVLVDGIPINEPSNAHAHGYADTSFVIPEVVERVHVTQGPFDARQGDFAIAGSARYALSVRERGLRARAEYGRFDDRRGLLLWAPVGAEDGTFVALDARGGEGFGPNRAYESFRMLSRYARRDGDMRYALLGALSAASFDSAGIVRQDDYDARSLPCASDRDSQFYCLYNPNQGGATARGLVSGQLGWHVPGRELTLQTYLGQRGLRMRDDFTGFRLDERGDGLDQRYDVMTLGASARYALSGRLFGAEQRFELGAFGRRDTGRTRMHRLRRVGGIPYATVFDTELALTHGGGYLRAELVPVHWLSLLLGVRADVFAFSTVDLAAPDADRVGERVPLFSRDAFGSLASPRGSLRARLTHGLSWIASVGTGLRSSDAQALSEGERAPFARALASETGFQLEHGQASGLRVEARTFAFATRVQDDLLFDPERGRNVPVGRSSRYGAGISLRLQLGDYSDTLASFAYAEAHAPPKGASAFDLSAGPVLPFVPRTTLRLDHSSTARLRVWDEPLALQGAFGIGYVGPRPLPLAASSESILNVDVSGSARVRMVELGAAIENLLDSRYHLAEFNHASQFDGPDGMGSLRAARHFAAGPPLRFRITLTLHLDETSLFAGDET